MPKKFDIDRALANLTDQDINRAHLQYHVEHNGLAFENIQVKGHVYKLNADN